MCRSTSLSRFWSLGIASLPFDPLVVVPACLRPVGVGSQNGFVPELIGDHLRRRVLRRSLLRGVLWLVKKHLMHGAAHILQPLPPHGPELPRGLSDAILVVLLDPLEEPLADLSFLRLRLRGENLVCRGHLTSFLKIHVPTIARLREPP